MTSPTDEEKQLRIVALQNAQSILAARRRSENDLVQAKDALERKTQELAQSIGMMHATLEAITDGMLAVDRNQRITGFNQKFVEMWQIPQEAVEPEEHHRLAHIVCERFRDPRAFLARVAEIYASAQAETFDLLELADGRVFERFSKIQVVNGINVGRVWIFRDITERRRAEVALQDETRILELLNETGKSLASMLDLQTLVQTVTDAATELSDAKFGAFFYVTKSADGDSMMLFTLSGAPREAFEKFGQPRATALFGPTFNGDDPIRCDDVLQDPRYGKMGAHWGMPPGHPPVRSYLAVPVVSRAGLVLGGLFFGHPDPGIFTERTERLIVGVAAQAAVAIDNARLYEAAQTAAEERDTLLASERSARSEAERMSAIKDEFLATLSHELRTPMNAILGWSQLLRRGNRTEADMHKGLATIERNARAQAQLIEDLLDMSRIMSGKVRLEIQTLEPVSFIEAAVETVRPAVDAKGIHLEVVLDSAAGPVSGDLNRLQQVIWNLLSNAIKFTPKDGKVVVRLSLSDSNVDIDVTDTGVGIKPAFLPHVFDRFRQADGSTTRKYGGLGLGLSIVKSLVELHGGTVRVSSPGEGGGASFTVQLPRMDKCSILPGEMRRDRNGSNIASTDFLTVDLSGLKVLVVDDEPDARDLINRVLADCNAEVLMAGSAPEAILLVKSERPDVLVSDIGMPEVDGYELLRWVRALSAESGGKVPAIALTAFARSEDRTRALHAGFLAHVAKPVEPAELVATVASVAGRAGAFVNNRNLPE